MAKKIRPIPVEEFPNVPTNCFGFAIGCTVPNYGSPIYNLNVDLPLADSFLSKLKELEYTSLPRKIDKIEDAKEGEYIFMVLGFNGYAYHVLRREPDKVWVHKPGWVGKPRIVTSDDWSNIYGFYGQKSVYFAITANEEE